MSELQPARRGLAARASRRLALVGWCCAMVLVLGSFPAAAQPANDNFANAEVIVGDTGTVSGSSLDATVEPGEPRHFGTGGASIWYRWTATNSGLATFDTIGSEFDTVLVAYAGTNLASLTKLAANDDFDPAFFTSRITFSTVA
ncbi:MAG TPA: peptidase S8, partial [Candidatus Binatia bacterium]|nr:peptidase S8 [Candidatus Binatia bacterium]